MPAQPITDWDDAYSNAAYIPGGGDYAAKWAALAKHFRDERIGAGKADLDLGYGPAPRGRLDLFHPAGEPRGLLIFVHGGYWMSFDKSCWSHLAAGPLAHGFAVAMPSYTLCPAARLADIVGEIARAVSFAAGRVGGPLLLAGHSAGGQLVSRMICRDSPLPTEALTRIRHVLSISGVHDLRPLIRTAMNATLRLDLAEARSQSPALLEPAEGARVTCWVGRDERPEFRRQNALLANVWTGLGAAASCVEEPGRHHFNVVDGLADRDHAITRALCLED